MCLPHLGKLEFWRRALDDLDTVIWRPYLECEPWEDDVEALPYVFMTFFLIGHKSYTVERQLLGRVMRQFGRRQGVLRGSGEYAWVLRERWQWGLVLPYD